MKGCLRALAVCPSSLVLCIPRTDSAKNTRKGIWQHCCRREVWITMVPGGWDVITDIVPLLFFLFPPLARLFLLFWPVSFPPFPIWLSLFFLFGPSLSPIFPISFLLSVRMFFPISMSLSPFWQVSFPFRPVSFSHSACLFFSFVLSLFLIRPVSFSIQPVSPPFCPVSFLLLPSTVGHLYDYLRQTTVGS